MSIVAADASAIAAAAALLRAGALVAFPTETVYGLGGDAGNDAAVAGIFAAKGRPRFNPLIVHVADAAAAAQLGAFDARAQALATRFWPGPLTLVLPRLPAAGLSLLVSAGLDTVAIRAPDHPVAQALLRQAALLGVAVVAAPSANRFGRVSPTTAQHVAAEFGDGLLVLDGGPCAVGIESTIIDCTRGAPVLLRPGQLARAAIERAAGRRLLSKDELTAPDPKASGTLAAHYAPRAKVRLMSAAELRTALQVLGADARHIAVWARAPLSSSSPHLLLRRMPQDAGAAAQQLFAVLRTFDDAGARLIWVETPPPAAAWDGVRDRLQRATAAG